MSSSEKLSSSWIASRGRRNRRHLQAKLATKIATKRNREERKNQRSRRPVGPAPNLSSLMLSHAACCPSTHNNTLLSLNTLHCVHNIMSNQLVIKGSLADLKDLVTKFQDRGCFTYQLDGVDHTYVRIPPAPSCDICRRPCSSYANLKQHQENTHGVARGPNIDAIVAEEVRKALARMNLA